MSKLISIIGTLGLAVAVYVAFNFVNCGQHICN